MKYPLRSTVRDLAGIVAFFGFFALMMLIGEIGTYVLLIGGVVILALMAFFTVKWLTH